MRLIIFLTAVSGFLANADVYVNPYYRSNGTYVQGYHRTAPDGNAFNNYSTMGNVNPYSGQVGTVNPYQAAPAFHPAASFQGWNAQTAP